MEVLRGPATVMEEFRRIRHWLLLGRQTERRFLSQETCMELLFLTEYQEKGAEEQ